jgi:predicted methyltransferase
MRGSRMSITVAVATSMLAMSGLAVPAARSQPKAKPPLFAPLDLGLLEAPDRDQWQKPELIMDELRIAEGSIVADVGAGSGWFTVRLARRVGPNGLVYAQDIQPLMLEVIERRIDRENYRNVRTVLGTTKDPGLPPGLDAVLIVDVYHEMEDPISQLANTARSLKPQGRIGVVEFTGGSGGPGPAADQRVNPESVIKAAEAAGLQVLTREAVLPFQYLIVLGRSSETRPAGGA